MKCKCGGELIPLETYCTDAYSKSPEWYRDIKQYCVCDKCGLHQHITLRTVKQEKITK